MGLTVLGLGFNPRARDGRELFRQPTDQLQQCFNPRARDGREGWVNSANDAYSVSIHAPVMDAN